MALEDQIEADIVSNVPDSSTAAAIGYSIQVRWRITIFRKKIFFQSGIHYEPCLHRNPYVGRSFIQPSNELRVSAIKKKFG